MGGVYGGLIVIILYGSTPSEPIIEDFFLYLDSNIFTLLNGEYLILL